MEGQTRRFLFIDLNSYFATGHQQAHPALRGKPVGVCEHSGGIILAASKEAKLLGIKTGTAVWDAKKICPDIALVRVNPDQIRSLTTRFYTIAERFSGKVEHASVDEVSIDLTGVCFSWEDVVEVAREIKLAIRKEMGEWITASLGIAENRLLAKIATDLQKPDGLVLIKQDADTTASIKGVKTFSAQDLYEVLRLEDVPGIGRKTARNLRSRGINSLKELSLVSVTTLRSWFGIQGLWLHDMSFFRDPWRNINLDERTLGSIGHQYSLGKRRAVRKRSVIEGLFWKLAEKVTLRMRKQGVWGSTIFIGVRYAEGGGLSVSKRVGDHVDDTLSVMKVALSVLEQASYIKAVTYINITVSGLSERHEQGVLFKQNTGTNAISSVLDKVNERHGPSALTHAPTLGADGLADDTVGFGRTRERKDWGGE